MSPLARGRSGRHRRRRILSGAAAALAAAGGGSLLAIAPAGSATAAGPGVAYARTGDWGTGYAARYRVTNTTGSPDRFTLVLVLPDGARLTSLWNAADQVDGSRVTVTPPAWAPSLAPGASLDVEFVVSGAAADPVSCRIDGADCAAGSGPVTTGPSTPPTVPAPPATTAPAPTAPAPTAPATTAPAPTTAPPSAPSAPSAPAAPAGAPTRFEPYLDTSLYPPYDMVSAARSTGVKDYTLAFVLSGGGCVPEWGGTTGLNQDGVPGQIGALRALGGDVRVSFGGANGVDLAGACPDANALAGAYRQVIDTYGLTQVDFDVEGAALADHAVDTRRAQAIALLQREAAAAGRTLDVSFTLPVLPSGLTSDGVNLLVDAEANGVAIGAVDAMAMDYGDGAAPNPTGRMGQYAIDAATATQAQVKTALGLSDSDAWARIAVTPMIGVNDTSTEVFTTGDARQLVAFAAAKGLARLSMWSLTRDQACPGGGSAQPTCSGVSQGPQDFTRIFGTY